MPSSAHFKRTGAREIDVGGDAPLITLQVIYVALSFSALHYKWRLCPLFPVKPASCAPYSNALPAPISCHFALCNMHPRLSLAGGRGLPHSLFCAPPTSLSAHLLTGRNINGTNSPCVHCGVKGADHGQNSALLRPLFTLCFIERINKATGFWCHFYRSLNATGNKATYTLRSPTASPTLPNVSLRAGRGKKNRSLQTVSTNIMPFIRPRSTPH